MERNHSIYLESILRHGLLPSGARVDDRTISPPSNHISLGQSCFDKDNWAAAIFVSPSLLYASDACYAELLMSGGENWRVVLRARVKPSSYSEHSSTLLSKYAPVAGEPENSEYRITSTEEDTIRRVEGSRHVIVTSVTFIKTSVLKDARNMNYDSLLANFGDGIVVTMKLVSNSSINGAWFAVAKIIKILSIGQNHHKFYRTLLAFDNASRVSNCIAHWAPH